MQTSSNDPTKDGGERLVRSVGSMVAYWRLAKAVIFAAIWTLVVAFFWSGGIPYYVILPALAIPVIVIALEVATFVRFKRADLSPVKTAERVLADPHEKVLGTVADIMRIGHRGGYAVLGTGSVRASENALIVTDKNIYAVTVPMAGAGKIVAGSDISLWQWMLGGKKIREKLNAIMSGGTLQTALDSMLVNQKISRADVRRSNSDDTNRTFYVFTHSGAELQYSALMGDEYQKAKTLLNA